MLRKVNKCSHGKRKPLLIHCRSVLCKLCVVVRYSYKICVGFGSDGVGRSGTYALVDLVLRRVTQGNLKELNVAATAEHLRDYRPEMIRSKVRLYGISYTY